jgi:hypothetical protein
VGSLIFCAFGLFLRLLCRAFSYFLAWFIHRTGRHQRRRLIILKKATRYWQKNESLKELQQYHSVLKNNIGQRDETLADSLKTCRVQTIHFQHSYSQIGRLHVYPVRLDAPDPDEH